ncbi:hypothetical protein GGX14DRAFT_597290 [Mycena pura]|uniref:AAA-ATPase-like domain-containing protein n=1 Tax=Mycena pura TaxID=153505 RepID=A0AAD6VMJ5_9AGAR|nr:hypothetical protein GGX14DRAFT_597290 [Mycena pura]
MAPISLTFGLKCAENISRPVIERIVRYTPQKGLVYEPSYEQVEPFELESEQFYALGDLSDDGAILFIPLPVECHVSIESDLSSPTPSTGSDRVKRSSPENDDNEQQSETCQKRVKSHPSPATELPAVCPLLLLATYPYKVQPCTRLPEGTDTFVDFCNRPSTAFVDKTRCILSLPDRFRCLLLRPPRFGKTTFLSTLEEYYDIRGATTFTDRFGSLAVVTDAPEDPPPLRSQHLCLCFNLEDMTVDFTTEAIATRLTINIGYELAVFLSKYATELQLSNADSLDENLHSFEKIFELVRASGHTLFVTVDNFDAPFRTPPAVPIDSLWIGERRASTREISNLLDSCFWAPLLAGSDVIHKLVVAGVLLPKHSLLQHLQLNIAPNLQVSCGFTEQEALNFASSVLEETVDIAELKGLCGGYVFPSQEASGDLSESLLHHQRLIDWIGRRIASHSHNTRDCASQLISNILEAIPKESVAGAVTVSDLIGLLATGAVEMDCEVDALVDYDPNAPTWAALYYAGALTPDSQQAGTFRLPNSAALSLIHSRIDTHVSDCYDLECTFVTASSDYCLRDDPGLLLRLLCDVLRDQMQCGLAKQREPNLRGVCELVMRNARISRGQRSNPIILLPTVRVEVLAFQLGKVLTLELKTLTLHGLWRGTHPNDDERMPTNEELLHLHKELLDADEPDLLARLYRTLSPTLNVMETVIVSSFFDPEPEHAQFLAVGGARILLRRPPKQTEDQQDEEDLDSGIDPSSPMRSVPMFDGWDGWCDC